MTDRELMSAISRKTGKFISIARVRRMLKVYSEEQIQTGLDKLLLNATPHLIPDPLSYIQRIISVELNKNDAQEILTRISLWDAE